MSAKWMTLSEIARERKVTVDEARHLVETSDCPKVFKTRETLYLI